VKERRSEIMMAQGLLPFQYNVENSESGLTSFAGLPLYIELAMTTGLCQKIKQALQIKSRGWTDLQIIMSLILLNLVGGDCVDDIERLELDEGMRTLLLKIETHGMRRKERREYERRWRKSKQRAFPSASAIRRYLEQFHHVAEERLREAGKAFIPAPNNQLACLIGVNSRLIEFAQERNPVKIATLDQDATLCETSKYNALYCYKHFKAYQPFNTYWHEQGLLLQSEFRDGNVNAGFEQLRLLQESLCLLPEGVDKVFLRSDSAGYQEDLLAYCAEGKHERFGVIEFAIATKVSSSFKQAVIEVCEEDWHKIYKKDCQGNLFETNQEWAEVCFVPKFAGYSKNAPTYRYIAIRERMATQLELDIEAKQLELPFQTILFNQTDYKLFGIVTNRTIPGDELIHWHRERCGESEKIHSVEKNDLAGGQLPSNQFGANAAWWQIMVLAFNLNQLMKNLIMPKELRDKRLKGLRFYVIGVAGRLIQHAHRLYIKLSGGIEVAQQFEFMRQNIVALAQAPPKLHIA
jgi:hypothetical protein